MKKIIFVSTGRCGTKRIFELFKSKELNAEVKHQMPLSRLANVVGNLMFLLCSFDCIKKIIYSSIASRFYNNRNFICSDPLTAMIIPKAIVKDIDTMIVHITRDDKEFAESIFKISRKRVKSFLAHNFIPFWQIGVWPLENIFNKKITDKYVKVNKIKNKYFNNLYSSNPNYLKTDMHNMFNNTTLIKEIAEFLDEQVEFSLEELSIKSN